MPIFEIPYSSPITYTDATGVSFVIIEIPGAEEMPDPDLLGSCGDGTWTCADGTGTTTMSGGQASIAPVGRIRLELASHPVLDSAKTYDVIIEATQIGTVGVGIEIGGDPRIETLIVGTNTFKGFTNLEVGQGGNFQIQPEFAADPNTIITSWSVREQMEVSATNVTISPISTPVVLAFDMDAFAGAGDFVEYRYDGGGNMLDPNKLDEFDQPTPLEAQTILLSSCSNNPVSDLAGVQYFSERIDLTWLEPNTTGYSPYKLYRNGVYLQDIAIGTTAFSDVNIPADDTYIYRIDSIAKGKVIASATTTVVFAVRSLVDANFFDNLIDSNGVDNLVES